MALGDATRQRIAETAMLTALNDPDHLSLLGHHIGLCHGTAGLLQAVWRMAADALTLHAIGTGTSMDPAWDRFLLLA